MPRSFPHRGAIASRRTARVPYGSMRIVVLLDQAADLTTLATRKGSWRSWFDSHVIDTLTELGHEVRLVSFGDDLNTLATTLVAERPDVVFNLVRIVLGDRGKDGYAAGLLEMLEIPYTGASPRGLFLAGDKALSKAI